MAEGSEGNRPVTLDDLKFIFEYSKADPLTEYTESEEVKKFRESVLERIEKLLHSSRILDDLERMS